MTREEAFLQAMVEDSSSALVFAGWLEDRGDPRGELLRLTHILTQSTNQPNRTALEERLRVLVAGGAPPIGPFQTNLLGMQFAWIPPGTFLMGSPANEPEREGYDGADETQHGVTLTKGFHLGVHTVTRAQFASFVRATQYQTEAETSGGAYCWTGKHWKLDPKTNWRNPGFEQADNHPVVCVSWNDALRFCAWLAEKDGKTYRLPTEAEWEYACRAGSTTPFHFGDTISTNQANYDGNYIYGNGKKGVYREKTTPVGSFPANAWGLFDMHGNVWEWCADWFGPYPKEELKDPQYVNDGEPRVLRGGSWIRYPWYCRSAFRARYDPNYCSVVCGCRVALCLD